MLCTDKTKKKSLLDEEIWQNFSIYLYYKNSSKEQILLSN